METLAEFEQTTETDPIRETVREEQRDPSKILQRRPPSRGLCRRCGQNKPINRLMLCYPCWVKTGLEEKAGWREGMPHPDWCRCEGLPEHARRFDGN